MGWKEKLVDSESGRLEDIYEQSPIFPPMFAIRKIRF
jgi:hypothetical protein